MVQFANTPQLNPTKKALAVEAWVKADKPGGVVLARGGPAQGYALVLRQGKPSFVIRASEKVSRVSGDEKVVGRWVHLAGVLSADAKLQLYVDGKPAGTAQGTGLISADPAQTMEVGADDAGAVGEYKSPFPFTGMIDNVRVYFGAVSGEEIAAAHKFDTAEPKQPAAKRPVPKDAKLVLACSFDDGTGKDASGNKHNGTVVAVRAVEGKFGRAMQFKGSRGKRPAAQASGHFVKHRWTQDIPLFVRAMVLADKTLFIAGPPDLMDEDETFGRLVARDKKVQARLAEQAAALDGSQGALLQAISVADGTKLAEIKLPSLPVWDSMAVAGGQLYLSTTDGKVVCLGAP